MTFDELKEKAHALPLKPGVYIMQDAKNEVIYVGKAKALKNRVSQYFANLASHTEKTRAMVSQIDHFDVIVADSEFEALILENSLIKRHQPHYNILLKDDKGYPYIRLTVKEPYPRFSLANRAAEDGARYFGPYGSRGATWAIVDALRANSAVTVVQNVVLSLLILAVFLYMKNKSRFPSRELRGVVVSLLVGVFLGICSSFLGIGGGPINVALIIYLFSFDTKTATVCSLVTILFAQISKLTTVALTTGFGVFDLSIAPVMIVGAIAGGFIGASLNKKCSEAAVEKAFNAVQLLVLAISIFNIVRNLAA